MPVAQPVVARYGLVHNVSMAVVALAMIGGAIVHFVNNPANAPSLSLRDTRLVLFVILAMALAFYAWLGVSRSVNREPQVIVDRDGIALGFGRNRRFAWSEVEWVTLRRLSIRPQLLIGLVPDAFVTANLRLSMLNFDDNLRPVRGMPAAVMVRDNGLDLRASALLDAVRSFRPNLVRP